MTDYFSYVLAVGAAIATAVLLYQDKRPLLTVATVALFGLIQAAYFTYSSEVAQARTDTFTAGLSQDLALANNSIVALQERIAVQSRDAALDAEALRQQLHSSELREEEQARAIQNLRDQLDEAVISRERIAQELSVQVASSEEELGQIREQLALAEGEGRLQSERIGGLNRQVLELSGQNIDLLEQLSALNELSFQQAQRLDQANSYAAESNRQLQEQERVRRACENAFFGDNIAAGWVDGVRCK